MNICRILERVHNLICINNHLVRLIYGTHLHLVGLCLSKHLMSHISSCSVFDSIYSLPLPPRCFVFGRYNRGLSIRMGNCLCLLLGESLRGRHWFRLLSTDICVTRISSQVGGFICWAFIVHLSSTTYILIKFYCFLEICIYILVYCSLFIDLFTIQPLAFFLPDYILKTQDFNFEWKIFTFKRLQRSCNI